MNRSQMAHELKSDYSPHAGCEFEMVKIHWSRVPCLCKLQLHLLFPTRVLLQQDEPF
jgi:hypothetical protein